MITRNTPFSLGTGFIVLVLASSCSTQSRIKHYSGDGEIKAIPCEGFWAGGGGYTLHFKPIKLDQPAHFTYRFSGLPRWRTEVLFAIEDSRRWEDKKQYARDQRKGSAAERNGIKVACYDDLTGRLAMSLKDNKGNLVFQFDKKLRDLVWSRAGQGPWGLYDERTVNITPDGREYVLEVTINPDAILNDNMGYVWFRGGGHEPVSIGF